MNKSFAAVALVAVVATSARAQNIPEPQSGTPADNGSIPATLIQPIEKAADYLNFFAFADGGYDATNIGSGRGPGTSGGFWDAGGGASAGHDFAKGTYSLSYRGDYRNYTAGTSIGGTDQNLNFFYRRILTRRWTISIYELAGIYPEGHVIPQPSPVTQSNFLQTNPYSLNLKFLGTTFATSYKQTNRLSYEFTGSFDIFRYNAPVSYGNDDGIGTASVLYRWDRRTTISGSYQYSEYKYQHNAGNATVNTVFLTLSRALPRRWQAGLSAGASRSDDSGTVKLPATIDFKSTKIPVYIISSYRQRSTLPYFQGNASRRTTHTLTSFSAGQSVTPGNGFFLASKTVGINGVFSYSLPRMSFSGGGYWSRLSSVSATEAFKIRTTDLDFSYSYNIIRHLGFSAHYDHVGYGTIGAGTGFIDNRFSMGMYFSSKDVPLAIF